MSPPRDTASNHGLILAGAVVEHARDVLDDARLGEHCDALRTEHVCEGDRRSASMHE